MEKNKILKFIKAFDSDVDLRMVVDSLFGSRGLVDNFDNRPGETYQQRYLYVPSENGAIVEDTEEGRRYEVPGEIGEKLVAELDKLWDGVTYNTTSPKEAAESNDLYIETVLAQIGEIPEPAAPGEEDVEETGGLGLMEKGKTKDKPSNIYEVFYQMQKEASDPKFQKELKGIEDMKTHGVPYLRQKKEEKIREAYAKHAKMTEGKKMEKAEKISGGIRRQDIPLPSDQKIRRDLAKIPTWGRLLPIEGLSYINPIRTEGGERWSVVYHFQKGKDMVSMTVEITPDNFLFPFLIRTYSSAKADGSDYGAEVIEREITFKQFLDVYNSLLNKYGTQKIIEGKEAILKAIKSFGRVRTFPIKSSQKRATPTVPRAKTIPNETPDVEMYGAQASRRGGKNVEAQVDLAAFRGSEQKYNKRMSTQTAKKNFVQVDRNLRGRPSQSLHGSVRALKKYKGYTVLADEARHYEQPADGVGKVDSAFKKSPTGVITYVTDKLEGSASEEFYKAGIEPSIVGRSGKAPVSLRDFLNSDYWDNYRNFVMSNLETNNPNRFRRVSDYLRSGREGSTYEEVLQDMKEALDNAYSEGLFDEDSYSNLQREIGDAETYHWRNKTLDKVIG